MWWKPPNKRSLLLKRFESLYGGQFTLSVDKTKLSYNYIVYIYSTVHCTFLCLAITSGDQNFEPHVQSFNSFPSKFTASLLINVWNWFKTTNLLIELKCNHLRWSSFLPLHVISKHILILNSSWNQLTCRERSFFYERGWPGGIWREGHSKKIGLKGRGRGTQSQINLAD